MSSVTEGPDRPRTIIVFGSRYTRVSPAIKLLNVKRLLSQWCAQLDQDCNSFDLEPSTLATKRSYYSMVVVYLRSYGN